MLSKKRLRKVLLITILAAICLPAFWITAKLIKTGSSGIWFPSYAKDLISGRYSRADQTKHMFVLVCDHWEPGSGEENLLGAEDWLDKFKKIAISHKDSQNRHFRYTWFYPIENFDSDILKLLSDATREGFGEVEVHWHHHHDSSSVFERELQDAISAFTIAGALISAENDKPQFAFIHGNWALDNSRPGKCGINDEIAILQRNGCYADLTFPSLGFSSQPSTINRIYYAIDTPEPKSHNSGETAKVGVDGSGLMMIEGPLGLNFRNMLILFENAAIDDSEGSGFSGRLRKPATYSDYFKPHRVHLWNQIGVSIEGRREWVFVKLHAHGMQHKEILLGGELDAALSAIESYCYSRNIKLHYIVAREAYNLVKAAEQEVTGPPEDHYNFVISPPLNTLPASLRTQ
jgi:hypothetical protein